MKTFWEIYSSVAVSRLFANASTTACWHKEHPKLDGCFDLKKHNCSYVVPKCTALINIALFMQKCLEIQVKRTLLVTCQKTYGLQI